ncbi:MAG: hypothetical protein M9951_14345 [Burkholderiaceae bacterium]|jgi:hypothetical protein|nr:hypothetical protein [Burkholderiaceae bacterium]MEB2320149.1 hypothetical protein [Pseudomonadota bacterium]
MQPPILHLAVAAIMTASLAACGNSGDSAPPPTNVTAAAGDGRIVLSWDSEPGIEYWIFGAADPGVTVDNWITLPESFGVVRGRSPQPVCALTNGTTYWATVNARTGTAGGGAGSAAVGETPRLAGEAWTTTTLDAPINGLGFGLIDYCRTVNANTDHDRPATGHLLAVGDAASIYTSLDGVNWTKQVTPVAEGFTADLHAIDVYTARPGPHDDLEQIWIATGDESATLRSYNGVDWAVTVAPIPGSRTLRALAHQHNLFVAVGDGGRIAITVNGSEWRERDSTTTENLNSIARENNLYVATGDNGTLLVSGDGGGWVRIDLGITARLRGAAYGNNNANPGNGGIEEIHTWVVVGDGGTVARSINGGGQWELFSLPGAPNLVGVGYTTAFIAVDEAGGVWRSTDGANWTGPVASGLGAVQAASGLSKYGILTALPGGRVASSF